MGIDLGALIGGLGQTVGGYKQGLYQGQVQENALAQRELQQELLRMQLDRYDQDKVERARKLREEQAEKQRQERLARERAQYLRQLSSGQPVELSDELLTEFPELYSVARQHKGDVRAEQERKLTAFEESIHREALNEAAQMLRRYRGGQQTMLETFDPFDPKVLRSGLEARYPKADKDFLRWAAEDATASVRAGMMQEDILQNRASEAAGYGQQRNVQLDSALETLRTGRPPGTGQPATQAPSGPPAPQYPLSRGYSPPQPQAQPAASTATDTFFRQPMAERAQGAQEKQTISNVQAAQLLEQEMERRGIERTDVAAVMALKREIETRYNVRY